MEVTLAVAVCMLVASGALMLLSQQNAFQRVVNEFSFLREEAPQINSLVAQLVSRSVSYRIYGDAGNAFAGVGAVNTGGKAVRLVFRNPDGLPEESVLAFEVVGGEGRFGYYHQNGSWPAQPDWVVSNQVADVDFSDDSGVLLMRLTGPSQEEITFAGTFQ